ncbi:thiamine pyrophosphate-dependent enzyme [Desulfoferula mesophila]|uniref:2-oxoglutarate synthase n=1 Tax=Desulfoferula mesophila TaxID=3058419 RepID=A0AAU9EMI4_9BACT|nr:2-oxoglutarate synthase [Desulfoferula mesophilus]
MHPLAEKMLRKSALPSIYCPGCGHGTVLNSFLRAVDKLGVYDNLALVGGIGCSGWTPVFIKADTIHALHGRAVAVATGLKLAQPDRKVVVFCGDGDCVAIGGNHFIHAARRNIDLTVVMLNNNIYGMTGGQVAPTTPYQARTQTSPRGNPEQPFDACELARAAGATYIARWTTAQPAQMAKSMREAMEHKGFAFVEVVVQCPTQAGRYMYGTGSAVDLYEMLKTNSVRLSKAGELGAEELAGKIVVGRLLQRDDRPEFTEGVYGLCQAKGV